MARERRQESASEPPAWQCHDRPFTGRHDGRGYGLGSAVDGVTFPFEDLDLHRWPVLSDRSSHRDLRGPVLPPIGRRVRPVVLSIAGSDSSGGAGLQADIVAITRAGGHPATAVTAVTAQSTTRVANIHVVPDEILGAQLELVLGDLSVSSIKTGLLATASHVRLVAATLGDRALPLVVDPVLIATSGDRLASSDVVEAIHRYLLPMATVTTPNLTELEALTGRVATDPAGMVAAARALLDTGVGAVVAKGGHLSGKAIDMVVTHEGAWSLTVERSPGPPVHGTGCTLAAIIATHLAFGISLLDAVQAAKASLTAAIEAARPMGGGARLLDPQDRRVPVHVHAYEAPFRS